MKMISGLAIDYGLDLKTNLDQINLSLGRIYANNDEMGESFLSLFTTVKIKQMFPPQHARFNFIRLLEEEITYERNFFYMHFI
jgi:hypothetical protein